MFKRLIAPAVTIFLLLLMLGQAPVYGSEVFDLSQAKNGVVEVNYRPSDKRIKVMVEKNGTSYYYDLNENANTFPLQMGSGRYNLALLENLEGNKYTVLTENGFSLDLADSRAPFLQSANPVYWNKEGKPAKLAETLTEGLATKEEKAYAVYEYIVNNIQYDQSKMQRLAPGYVPMAEVTLAEGKGICYDYAALYAAMLRSLDIPTKLIKGYKNDIEDYHAWNEVYSEEAGWLIVDTTYDAALQANKSNPIMAKDAADYKKEKEY